MRKIGGDGDWESELEGRGGGGEEGKERLMDEKRVRVSECECGRVGGCTAKVRSR